MSTLEVTYKYEVFAPDGTYLGVLPKPASDFTYSQDINTAGSQIVITTAQDIDTQQLPVMSMTDESGNPMTDESGTNFMTTDRAPDTYGNSIRDSQIQDGNRIRIWEYTQWQPNGVLVFDGKITKWNPHIGSNDAVDMTVLSYGVELDNQPLFGSLTIDQVTFPANSSGSDGWSVTTGQQLGQIFFTGPNTTQISGFIFQVGSINFVTLTGVPATFNLSFYTYTGGNPDTGTLIGTISGITSPSGSETSLLLNPLVEATFGSPITVAPNTYYAFVLSTSTANVDISFSYTGTNSYQPGASWNKLSGVWHQIFANAATSGSLNNMAFMTLTPNSANQFTNSIYLNQDPSAMTTDFVGNYISPGGGHVGIGNIAPSSASATVAFILNTVHEGITECLTIAPSGYYWYVDVGSSLLYFQPKSTSPDHVFTFKVHIGQFELLVTSENTINAAYLTAGNNISGAPIMVFASNAESIARFGQVLDRVTDTRILDATSAQLVVNNYVATSSVEQYQSTINIYASNYDLTTLKLGQVVGFNGFNSYADTLQMQIVSIARYSDYAQLTLGTVPVRASSKAERIERSLLSTQTMNNPLTAL